MTKRILRAGTERAQIKQSKQYREQPEESIINIGEICEKHMIARIARNQRTDSID